MKHSALTSLLLHIFLLIFLIVGIPFPERQTPVIEQPFIMEFEQIGPKSMAPVLTPKTSLKASIEKKQEAQPKELAKEEPKPAPTPAPKVEATPPAPKHDQKQENPPKKEDLKKEIVPDKKPETDPLLKKEPKKEDKKQPPKEEKKDQKKDAKKDVKKEEPKKAEVNLDPKKAKPLTKAKPLADKKTASVDDLLDQVLDDKASAGGENSERGAPAAMVGEKITATDIDAVRSQIAKCWLVPIGGQEARDMIVDVVMDIAKDGTVQKADVVNKRPNDPGFQAAAESAQRAVLDPACNPLPLPPEKYEKWKRLTLRFNPRDMY